MILQWCKFNVGLCLNSLASPRSGSCCAPRFSHGLGKHYSHSPHLPALAPALVTLWGCSLCKHSHGSPSSLRGGPPTSVFLSFCTGGQASLPCACALVRWWEHCVCVCVPLACRFSLQGSPRCVGSDAHTSSVLALRWEAARWGNQRPQQGPHYGAHLPGHVGTAAATNWDCAAGFAPGLCGSKILWKCLFLLFVCGLVIKSWCCFVWKIHKWVNLSYCAYLYVFYDNCYSCYFSEILYALKNGQYEGKASRLP